MLYMEIPPPAANDNEPKDKVLDRAANVGSTKLLAISTVLATIAYKGFSSPQGRLILSNLMKGLFN